jgi:long-chain acyl-CoA synthetase
MALTIYESFVETVNKFPAKTSLMYKKNERYVDIKYKELQNYVEAVSDRLSELGIKKGTPVAIFSYNRPEWVIADLAVLRLGGIVVPIYHTLPDCLVKYIINDSKTELLFVENAQLFSLVKKVRNEMPSLKNIVVFDYRGIAGEEDFIKFDELKMKSSKATPKFPDVLESDIATYVYTSGTTAEPKGVMLTHENILSNVFTAIKQFKVNEKDVLASFLPLCHMFERTGGYYTMLIGGAAIGYVENLSTIAKDIKMIRPTVLITVPRLLEKVYEEVTKKVEAGSFIQKKLVRNATRNLIQYTNLKDRKRKISLWLKFKRWFFNRVVGTKFRKLAGGRVRLIVTGSAAMNKKIGKLYSIFGFNIVEGYGLTETAPVVCVNRIEDNRFGTVGKPFNQVIVKIGDNDEILVKGPNLMIGYLNKPEETAKAIDNEGWFHTGDQGRFDNYGNLIITGRIKELIVTSYGKNIAPVPIEQKLSESKFIEQIMLYGDKKKCIIALIVPNQKFIENYAKENSITFNNYVELLQEEEVKKVICNEIKTSNLCLAPYEQVKSFALLAEPFTIENGLLTPTLKVRRNEIVKKYRDLIESLYKDLEKNPPKAD